MLRVEQRVDVVIHRDPAAYASHPCVARMQNGDLLVAFNETLPRRPHLHPPDDPRSLTLVARSTDAGRTWSAPRAAPGYDMSGVECPSLLQTRAGTVLLLQWRFRWYSLETARKRARASDYREPYVIAGTPLSEYAPPASESEWEHAPLPWARTDGGLYCSLSTDHGATWDQRVSVQTAPFARGYSPRPPTQLADGTLVLALGSHDEHGVIYVLRSNTEGRTWESPHVVDRDSVLAEPSIAALPGDRLLIVSRDDKSGFLHQHESGDGGRTWSPARRLAIWGYPPHLLQLSDGRLLVIYGVRRPPFSIRACLSMDGGATWDTRHELVVRDDLMNTNLGYPTAIELAPGTIFCAYYTEDAEGVTHIVGSTFALPPVTLGTRSRRCALESTSG